MRCWSWMNSGRLWAAKSRRSGCGLRCVAALVRWRRGTLETEAPPLAARRGTRFPQLTKERFVTATCGRRIERCCPNEQHQACGKEEAETNHVERFNLTLRQRLGRLTRKTLSFSKSVLMHLIVFRLFLVHYNKSKAKYYNLGIMAP